MRQAQDGTLLFSKRAGVGSGSGRTVTAADLFEDDELANAEAAAMNGIPGYCSDRYYKAIAGEDKCRKFEK